MTRPLSPVTGTALAALGGGAGAGLRWLLTEAAPASSTGGVPWVVVAINVVGSLLLAVLLVVPAARRRPWLTVLLGTGVLGGFTTMSAASADTFTLLDAGRPAAAAAYVLGTVVPALLVVSVVLRWGARSGVAE